VSLSALYQLRFADVPRFYLAGFGLLLSLPCFFVWCLCLVCSARFAKQDLSLVEQQRLESAKAQVQKEQVAELREAADDELSPQTLPSAPLVDCTEAMSHEYELIYTA
ncbi:unnamed protein product, partial [Polarella glacialis]